MRDGLFHYVKNISDIYLSILFPCKRQSHYFQLILFDETTLHFGNILSLINN